MYILLLSEKNKTQKKKPLRRVIHHNRKLWFQAGPSHLQTKEQEKKKKKKKEKKRKKKNPLMWHSLSFYGLLLKCETMQHRHSIGEAWW
ncbi:LOW QUALITY PROTEIN: hypothetical protein TorRG33x02_011670 [Trema orientale]|uniref:Uncharacterized protein n=1 Tax=Trema orientale TaxID=63057 RepID=A0A2P5FZ94_TREOI|nr:LOW QUALITY PROTEIN: hypothetical protein TorRG33x02_011670 [Trema orientale]